MKTAPQKLCLVWNLLLQKGEAEKSERKTLHANELCQAGFPFVTSLGAWELLCQTCTKESSDYTFIGIVYTYSSRCQEINCIGCPTVLSMCPRMWGGSLGPSSCHWMKATSHPCEVALCHSSNSASLSSQNPPVYCKQQPYPPLCCQLCLLIYMGTPSPFQGLEKRRLRGRSHCPLEQREEAAARSVSLFSQVLIYRTQGSSPELSKKVWIGPQEESIHRERGQALEHAGLVKWWSPCPWRCKRCVDVAVGVLV